MSTLQIIFENTQCRAVIVSVKFEKIIPYPFEEKDKLPSILAQLKSLYEKDMRVCVSIPAQEVMIRDFTLDAALSDNEIIQFLQSKSVQLFGYPPEKLSLDYETNVCAESDKKKIIVVATHRALIQTIQDAFRKVKIPIAIVHVSNLSSNINLLPWRALQSQRKRRQKLFTYIAFAIIIFVATITTKYIFLHETNLLASKTKHINQISAQIILNHPHQHALMLQQLKSISIKKSVAIKDNEIAETALNKIAAALPENITLTSLNFNFQKIKIKGVSDQLSTIHTYSEILKQTLSWKNVSLIEIHNDSQNKSQSHFTIQVTP